jgi:hypothetical protein
VDDTVYEEDFQDMNEENDHFPQYPPFYSNVYNQAKRLESLPFCSNEWEGERGCST